MATAKKNFTERLAKYICNLKYEDLPAEVVSQAKRVILDALGCQVACSLLENGQSIIKFSRRPGGRAEASVLGSNYKTSAVNAALVNGTLGHGDEIDESLEEVGHASAVIVPSALACGERKRANGKDMIAAVVAGYDMAGRLANAGVAMSKLMMGYNTGLTATFWGVATAANMMKLSLSKTKIALGLAGCQAGGFYNFDEAQHMAKSLMCGLGARNGVTAASLARMGYDAPNSIFDGDNNILRYFVGKNYDQGELTKDLGQKFVIMNTCIKLYSAGHPIHAPANGLLKILTRDGLSAEDIKSITVHMPTREKEVVDNRDMANICLQYCLAVAVFDRQLTWDQYAPERLNDPRVAEMKSRVVAVADPRLDERKKITKAHSAEVVLETKGGRKFTERVDYPPGDPGNPASQEDIEKKVMYYASKALGKEKTKRLIQAVKNLEDIPDLNQLGDLLRI